MTVSNEAVEAAARAAAKDEDASGWDEETEHYRNGWRNRMQVALEAAAPLIQAQALEGLTRSSPRLPAELRSHVFEIVFEVVDKFNFPAQNCGALPGVVEIGDVCGEVEKRTVALLRAAALRGQG